MKRKIFGFLVCTLFITTIIPFSVISEVNNTTSVEILSISGGFLSISSLIKNTGPHETEKFIWHLDVDSSELRWCPVYKSWYEYSGLNLAPNETKGFGSGWTNMLFGFGPIYVNLTVFADNADIVWKEEEGFVIGPFVII